MEIRAFERSKGEDEGKNKFENGNFIDPTRTNSFRPEFVIRRIDRLQRRK